MKVTLGDHIQTITLSMACCKVVVLWFSLQFCMLFIVGCFSVLSKNVCKICKKRTPPEFRGSGWIDFDDEHWNKKLVVFCPCEKGSSVDISKNPPLKCKYRLEHVLDKQWDTR